MEIITKQDRVLLHIKDGAPVAVTIMNGHAVMYSLVEMSNDDVIRFYEADKAQI